MCQNCFNSESTLMVHHRIYISGQEPWDYDDDLLITLCEDCHKGESINMPVHEKGLIEAVKLNFLSEDVQELIGGFRRMRLQHSHERVATAISWAIQTPEIQRELIDRHKKYLGECYIAKTR